ncbi:MAG: hypothetical protein EBX65_01255 [Betaproteobacteria bacterium]|nr:hypothetical protein [Betaproteobacteria bacterium]
MIPIENSQEAREACDKIGEAIAVLTNSYAATDRLTSAMDFTDSRETPPVVCISALLAGTIND